MTLVVDVTATWAATLSDTEFRSLVDDDTRGKVDEDVSTAVRSPELMERWYLTLLSMQNSVEGQLAAKSAESLAKRAGYRRRGQEHLALNEESRHEQWKAGALRFKNGLDEKLIEARGLLHKAGSSLVKEGQFNMLSDASKRIAVLEGAIRTHREACLAGLNQKHGDDDATEFDHTLWAVLPEDR